MLDLSTESLQSQTSRSNLITAFRRVVAMRGRRQATDLHVRRLLCYVLAKNVDGQGARRSLKQIADRLILSVSTCRRVIRRAVKHFGLLIVIPQRHTPGGQSVNRYTINWHHVDTILSSTSSPGNTDVLVGSMPVRLAPDVLVGSSDPSVPPATPISRRALAAVSPGRSSLKTSCYNLAPPVPYNQALDHTICPSGSDPVRLGPRAARTGCPLRSTANLCPSTRVAATLADSPARAPTFHPRTK